MQIKLPAIDTFTYLLLYTFVLAARTHLFIS